MVENGIRENTSTEKNNLQQFEFQLKVFDKLNVCTHKHMLH